MRINDHLHFAPGITFDQVDVDGPGLPGQYRERILGFYLDPADQCSDRGQGFAAGVLIVSCIDALARLRYGGDVGPRFKKFACLDLQSFSTGGLAKRFYDEFRNGLVHEARLKAGGQFRAMIGGCYGSGTSSAQAPLRSRF